MKVATENHKVEKVMLEIEKILEDNNMTISYSYMGLQIDCDGKEFFLTDISNGSIGIQLPRGFEEEKFVLAG